jgi:hypothetical protein
MNVAVAKDTTSVIASALQQLIDGVRPQGNNYLIVSSGDAYLQFSRNWGDVSMLTEAVSNYYRPDDRQLDQAAIEILHDMGFEDPGVEISPSRCCTAQTAIEIAGGAPARSPNYFRYFDVSTPDKVAALAELVVEALSAVYGEDPAMRLDLQLRMGIATPTVAAPDLLTEGATPSGDEPAWAQWSIRWSSGEEPVIYATVSGEEIATVHGGEAAFGRCLLLQRAPTLLEAVRISEQVFRLVAEGQLELDPAMARELLPALQAALYLLDDQRP